MSCYLFMLIASWIAGNYILHRTSASGVVVSPRNQTVKEGDDAFFNCTQYETNGSDISGLRYSWSRRDGEAVLSNTSRLNLKNVNRTDAGIYTCTVTNVSANWSDVDNATLHVSYSPGISYWTMNRTVNESSRTSLFCNATGYPPPSIQWNLTDGSSVTISNNISFAISHVSRSQHGRYSCQAYNDAGSSNPKFGYLNVQYKPKISRTDLKNTSKTWLHQNSTFTCQADGNPSPVVSWSRGLKIAPDTGINSSSRIFVSPKSNEDFGFYNCTARNELGIDEFHMELKRSAFPPDQPDILNGETNLTSPILKPSGAVLRLSAMAFFTRLVGRQEPAPLQLPTESTFYFDVQAQRWRTRGEEHLEDDFDLDAPLPEVKAVISPVPELAEKTEKTAVEELMTPPMVYTTEVLKRRGAQAAQVDKPSMDLDIESCATASPPNSPSLTEQSDAPTRPEVDFPETPVPRTPVIREPFGNQLEHLKLTGLLHMLNEQNSNIEVCAKVCSALEGFALRDPKNLFTIIESGCVEELFVALERFANEDPVAQAPIVELLWSLSFEEMAVDRVAERSKASLMSLAGIMQRHEVQGMARLQACVCGTLVNLAVRKQTCIEMVHCGLMEQICIALQQHADCPELQELGCQALYMVANHPELRPFVLAAGAVPAAKVGHEKWGSWLQEILLC